MAVASAEPYANSLHLAPGRSPCQHLVIQFLQAACSSDSAKALKDIKSLMVDLYSGRKTVAV